MPIPDDSLLRLLDLWINEELSSTVSHQKSTQFYSSLISATLAATIAGAMNARTQSHLWFLLIGPVLVISVSWLAISASKRLNKRFIEAITVRAKLEQALGLCDPLKIESQSAYWRNESFVAPRHLGARKQSRSSEEFISRHLAHGLHAPARNLFVLFIAIGTLLATALMLMAINGA